MEFPADTSFDEWVAVGRSLRTNGNSSGDSQKWRSGDWLNHGISEFGPQHTAAIAATGDYSVAGLEGVIAIERKSEGDMLSCVGTQRERFDKEIQRLLAFPCRALVIESTWQRFETGKWRSKVTPAAAVASLLGWCAAGVPVIMAANHELAGQYVAKLLFIAARRRWREARALVGSVMEGSDSV